MAEKTFGLALSGGGARAIAHLGLLQYLEDKNIPIEVLSGASAGGLIASLWAKGYAAKEILAIFQHFSFCKILQYSFSNGFLSQKKLYKLLRDFFPENDFSALSKKVWIACTDLKSVKIVYFSQGKIIEPLLGTLAIPPLMRPVDFMGQQLLDGGILNNLPVQVIRPHCDFLLASHSNPARPQAVQTMREAIEKTFLLAIAQNTQQAKNITDLYFEPPFLADFRFTDIKKMQKIYHLSYEYAQENLKI
ncbi:MAG: patatin-like phospholipase family protein [Raineya sp.]